LNSNRYSLTQKSNWISVNELKTYFVDVFFGVLLMIFFRVAPSLPWLSLPSNVVSCHKKLESRRSKASETSPHTNLMTDWSSQSQQHLWRVLTRQKPISIQMNHLKIRRRPFFTAKSQRNVMKLKTTKFWSRFRFPRNKNI
jgi:hypothetical protein